MWCGEPISPDHLIKARSSALHQICFEIGVAALCADLESRGRAADARDVKRWSKIVLAKRIWN